MADNIAVTAGSGTTIATDDVGGAQYQRVKACWGVDGAANDTSASNPLPTTLTNLEKAEDAAHSSGHSGIMALGVITTSETPSTATDGDYAALSQNVTGALRVATVPNTVGGLLFKKTISLVAAAQVIKASAGQIFGFVLHNTAASKRFVKFYNVAAASVVVGTTVPDITIELAAGETVVYDSTHGIQFTNAGFSFAGTNLVADNDATAPTANDITATIFYK